jgi:FG-GAP-like repeat
MAPPSLPEGKLPTWFWAVLVLLVAVGLLGVWREAKPPPPDMVAVMQANNRGVGHMEQYREGIAQSVKDFEEVVRLAPNWLPGQINLGIALMNLARGDLPDEEKEKANERALALFEGVLKKDPKNPYAHFCRGLIIYWRYIPEQYPQAREDFRAVTQIDPKDPFSWFWLGKVSEEEPDQAISCYQRALELDPYLNAARFSLRSLLQQTGRHEEAKAIFEQWDALKRSEWDTPSEDKYYTDRGRYARLVGAPDSTPPAGGRLPLFRRDDQMHVQLAAGARWATAADFGNGPDAELRKRVRQRFGGVLVVLDYNGDGKPDLFLLGAVVEGGQVRDLLLRNDGDGRFTDVTEEAGLGGARPTLGCCVADFDNDDHPDLFLTGAGQVWLFRNNQKGGFEDVTAKAGLDKLQGVSLGAAFVDLDQDGDLDLLVAGYADTPEHALAALDGKEASGAPGLMVYLNVGEARAATKGEDPPPLPPRFRKADGPPGRLGDAVPAVNLAVTDLDLDHDLDLFVLGDGKPPALVLNDRLLRFHRTALPESAAPAGKWNGALVLDSQHQERSDLLLLGPGRAPTLLRHRPNTSEPDTAKWFGVETLQGPALLQAHAVDVDFDTWTDVVGLSEERRPVLLRNDGRRLVHVPEALGSDRDWPGDLAAVAVAGPLGLVGEVWPAGPPQPGEWQSRPQVAAHRTPQGGTPGPLGSQQRGRLRRPADRPGRYAPHGRGAHDPFRRPGAVAPAALPGARSLHRGRCHPSPLAGPGLAGRIQRAGGRGVPPLPPP